MHSVTRKLRGLHTIFRFSYSLQIEIIDSLSSVFVRMDAQARSGAGGCASVEVSLVSPPNRLCCSSCRSSLHRNGLCHTFTYITSKYDVALLRCLVL